MTAGLTQTLTSALTKTLTAVLTNPATWVAVGGALGLKGIHELLKNWTGKDNKVDPKTGNIDPGWASSIDSKGDKSIATFLQTTGNDRGRNKAQASKQTSRGQRYDQQKLNEEVGNESVIGQTMGLTTRKRKMARIAFYRELAREMAEEKENELRQAFTVKTTGSGSRKRTTKVQDPEKVAAIEADYAERLARMEKSYKAEGLSHAEVRKAEAQDPQKLQNGGPLKVPGSGSGDKVPMALPAGSFVLNRNASNFLFRQEGGMVNTLLEPGERVFMPGEWDKSIHNLNNDVPRFQSGGAIDKNVDPKAVGKEYGIKGFNKSNVGYNLRYLSTGDAMNLAKLQTGGLVLFQGHGDVPPGHSQPGTDGPHSSIQGKYKPTAEQYFMDLIGKKAASKSESITYSPPTGKYASGFEAGANWARMRDLRNKGQSAIELHADGYDGRPGKFKGRPGVLPGTATGPTGAVGEAEENIRRIFGMYGGTRTANILELDNIMNVSQTPDKYVDMLVHAAEGTGAGISVENISDSSASGGGGTPHDSAVAPGGGTGVEAILKACEANIGLSKGVAEQCANTTRAVLKAAGHPAAAKTTSTGDLEKDGVPQQYRAGSYAASFGGRDMGAVTDNYKSTKAGDIILWKGTYGVEKWGADAITHVGIKGEGSDVYHHGSGPGWRKQSGYPISSKFAYGVTLNGTGAADGSKGTSSNDGTANSAANSAIKSSGATALMSVLMGFFGLGGVPTAMKGMLDLFTGSPASAATLDPSTHLEDTSTAVAASGGDKAKSNKPYDIASSIGFSREDWDIYRNAVGQIESGNTWNPSKDKGGGSGGKYDGRWQLGWMAKTDAAKYLGEDYIGHEKGNPGGAARMAFRRDPAMQERYFAAFTAKNHQYLTGHPKYDAMSTREKFEVLGYAHNQGAAGARTWLDTGVVGQDGFGTKADKYAKALRSAYNSQTIKRQQGGMIPTLLEPGETVGTMEMWNQAIPRFQSGGSVNMGGTMTPTSKSFYEKTSNMENGNAPIIVMGGGGKQHSTSRPAAVNGASNPAPALSSGPSMASLNDYINRVSWSSVF